MRAISRYYQLDGRVIDALIAEKFFKQKVVWEDPTGFHDSMSYGPCYYSKKNCDERIPVEHWSSSITAAQKLRDEVEIRGKAEEFMEALRALSYANGEGPWSRWIYMNLPPIFTARAVLIMCDFETSCPYPASAKE